MKKRPLTLYKKKKEEESQNQNIKEQACPEKREKN
jgi:hypothetical protein